MTRLEEMVAALGPHKVAILLALMAATALGCAAVAGLSVRATRRHRSRLDEELFGARSAHVRTGQLVESLAPLIEGFPVDVTKPGTSTTFLGQPVDYVHFDPEEGVVFVEVKSAGAQLSPRQRALREHVEQGRVAWRTFRVAQADPDG